MLYPLSRYVLASRPTWTRQQKIELILWRARGLAAQGYYPWTIKSALVADGFAEASELIGGNLERELRQAAEEARKRKQTVRA